MYFLDVRYFVIPKCTSTRGYLQETNRQKDPCTEVIQNVSSPFLPSSSLRRGERDLDLEADFLLPLSLPALLTGERLPLFDLLEDLLPALDIGVLLLLLDRAGERLDLDLTGDRLLLLDLTGVTLPAGLLLPLPPD